jgi:hypothetical protein
VIPLFQLLAVDTIRANKITIEGLAYRAAAELGLHQWVCITAHPCCAGASTAQVGASSGSCGSGESGDQPAQLNQAIHCGFHTKQLCKTWDQVQHNSVQKGVHCVTPLVLPNEMGFCVVLYSLALLKAWHLFALTPFPLAL